ncbi:MAG: hypothetical protein MZU97_20985 [Bacillus subtilis]|nr:hypothetical protein [Bacillus subtilis]
MKIPIQYTSCSMGQRATTISAYLPVEDQLGKRYPGHLRFRGRDRASRRRSASSRQTQGLLFSWFS